MLDVVRRARAFDAAAFLSGPEFRERVIDRLATVTLFHEWNVPPENPVVFSDDLAAGTRGVTLRRFTGRSGSLMRWTRRLLAVDGHTAERVLQAVAAILGSGEVGLLTEVALPKGQKAWAVATERLRLEALEQPAGHRCPKCGSRFDFEAPRPCPRCIKTHVQPFTEVSGFFRSEYAAGLGDRARLLAEEHSAQVPGVERKEAERKFEDPGEDLDVLVCTPTMELGIDIGELTTVYLRNVPPSPANYVQRAGRAGRAGQPALVTTFCGSGGLRGPHDRYFFERPLRMIEGRIAPPRFLLDNESLLAAHLHSLIFEHLDVDLPTEPEMLLDLDAEGAPLREEKRAKLLADLVDRRETIIVAALAAFAGEVDELVWLDRRWIEQRVDAFVEDFDGAWDHFREELAATKQDLKALQELQLKGQLAKDDERRMGALSARLKDMRKGEGDHYPYRLLSSDGFLPGYAFPRRSALAFFTDRKETIGRGRAIALREFAPNNSIYYRGQRYEVVRAQVRAHGGDSAWTRLKACHCGHFLRGEEVDAQAACPSCGSSLIGVPAFEHALELPDAVARRRQRVGSDEEERIRRGYAVDPHFQLPGIVSGGRLGPLGVTYGHNARLLLVNGGFRASDDIGFRFCTRCRLWNPDDDHFGPDQPCGEASDSLVEHVTLFVEGQHDMLVLDLSDVPGVDETLARSLGYAVEVATEVAFQLDGSELANYVFFSEPTGWRILVYETDEGGIGVLHQLGRGEGWNRLLAHARQVLHVTPEGEQDDACAAACYDCLLSFYNQQYHDLLDRRPVVALFDALRGEEFAPESSSDGYEPLLATAIGMEGDVLKRMIARGLPAPDDAHKVIDIGGEFVEADLFYAYGSVCVFCDGTPHDQETVAAADEHKRAQLKNRGYKVVAVGYRDLDQGLDELSLRLGL